MPNRPGRHEGHGVDAGLGVAIDVHENADVGVDGGGDEVDGEAGDADQAPGYWSAGRVRVVRDSWRQLTTVGDS